jgi:hypothetical protein
MQGTQHPERAADRLAALGAEQRGHLPVGHDPLDVIRGPGLLERVRIAADQPLGQVDLFERGSHRVAVREIGRHEHRPELCAHPARPQPGQVGVRLGDPGGQLDPVQIRAPQLAQGPGQVVVPVQDR